MSKSLILFSRALLLFLILFAPLAFGTVEPWSYAIMQVAAMAALVAYAAGAYTGGPLYRAPGMLPLMLYCAYIGFQMIPLPPLVIKHLSPGAFEVYSNTLFVLSEPRWVSLSLDRRATLLEFMRISVYVSIYFLSVQHMSRGKGFMGTARFLIAASVFVAAIGLVHFASMEEKVLWFRTPPEGATPFGPFVNKNHFANLVAMIAPFAAAMFMISRPDVSYARTLKEKFVEVISSYRTNRYIAYFLAVLIIAASVMLSLSRGGALSMTAALALFGLLAARRNRKIGIVMAVFFVLLLVVLSFGGWDMVAARFQRLAQGDAGIESVRPRVWRDAVDMIRDFQVFGVGAGGFEALYPAYRNIPGRSLVSHAHNDYLQFVAEGGLAAAALAIWFLASVFRKAFLALKGRRDSDAYYLAAGAFGSVLVMLFHAFVDFSFYIGANGLYFFIILALFVSASCTRVRAARRTTYLSRLSTPEVRVAIVLSSALMVIVLIVNAGVLMAKARMKGGMDISLTMKDADAERLGEDLLYASRHDPLNAVYSHALARLEVLRRGYVEDLGIFSQSIALEPTNGDFLMRAGELSAIAGNKDAALVLVDSALRYGRVNSGKYERAARWLLGQGRFDEATGVIRRGVALEPERMNVYFTIMYDFWFSDDDVLAAMPPAGRPYIMLGNIYLHLQRHDLALRAYSTALGFDDLYPMHYVQIARYYERQSMYDEAVAAYRAMQERFPRERGAHEALARLYQQMGLQYRAAEEYRRALEIWPDDAELLKKIEDY